jgi:predicted dehydrogenase
MNSPRLSRRSFLQSALAAGVAPLLLPSRVWSAETKPNSQLGLGFIGMGKQNGGLLGGFQGRPDVKVLAVCDVDTTRREAAKKTVVDRYAKGGATAECASYSDFRELLARKDIDAVVIATPDHWHTFIAIEAAKAGKDIYCEKPLTNTVYEAQALVAATRKADRVFQVGSQQRSSREFRVACELVRNGKIGKLTRVTTGFGGPGKSCDLPEEAAESGLDWDMWLGPAPMRPYNSVLSPRGVHNHFPAWRNYWEYGGGMVTDWGAHHLDIAQWGLGADENGPVEIIPPADALKAQQGTKLRYASGVEVEHISENGATFFGSDGEIYVNRGKFRLTLGGKQLANFTGAKDAKEEPLAAQLERVEKEFLADAKVKLHPSGDHKTNWIECIRSRQRPICDVAIGASSVIACHLMNFAYRYGKGFQWDPAKGTFAGGTGDAKWLTREYREKWKVA